MILCDTHADTLFRRAIHPEEALDVTFDGLKKGGVTVQTMALYVGGSTKIADIRDTFDKMIAEIPNLEKEGLKKLSDYRDAKDGENAYVLSVEGCDGLDGDLSMLEKWRKMGVRMAALTWNYENCVATPAKLDDTTPLKPFGREAVKEMQRLGMAADTSHLNIRGFYDLLEMGIKPLASHSCCRALCDHKRNLTDQQLKDLFAAGGYVGVNFYPWFLNENGHATVEDICDHVMRMVELGGEDYIGFGSDFDGIEVKPEGLNGPHDFPVLMGALKNRGLSDQQLEKIAGLNLLRYYDRIDPRK